MNARNQTTLSVLLAGAAVLAGCGAGNTEDGDSGGAPALFDAPAAGTEAAPETLDIPDGAPTVAFVGDSIGAGLHLAEHQAFPAVLQRQLFDEGMPFHLVNASESGRTTAGGVTVLAWVMQRKPDAVVIELGGNDGLRGVSLEDVEKNLRAMVETARRGGSEVLLLGVRLPPNYGDYGAQFDAMYPRLAEELKLAFVPYYMEGVGGVAEQNLEDGLHPTPEGHLLLAENVQAELRKLLLDSDNP